MSLLVDLPEKQAFGKGKKGRRQSGHCQPIGCFLHGSGFSAGG